MTVDTTTWWTAVLSAFWIGLLLGALPAGAAEAIALATAAIPSVHLRAWVLIVFTAGHILGKVLWYLLGRLGSRIKQPWLRKGVDSARALAKRHPNVGIGLAVSSSTLSLPPFHLMAVAAGIVQTPPLPFFVVAYLGRLLRFATIAAFPALLKYLFF